MTALSIVFRIGVGVGLAACGGACHSATQDRSPPPQACGGATTAATPDGVKPLHFAAADGVMVSADLYMPHPATAPIVVLFHQAGSSRGEYRSIAPRLNQLGFNALAVDARSGAPSQGVGNDTASSACQLEKPATYLDAIADLQVAVGEARKLAQGKLVVWGSSYSSSLVLVLGAELHADAVLAFSPGEYFDDLGKPATWVADGAKSLAVPTFITSARDEASTWSAIAAAIDPGKLKTFTPTTAGRHGSSALWPTQPDADAYWTAVTAFLQPLTAP